MEREQILAEFQSILRDVLEDDSIVISEETSAKDIAGWDSLSHINVIEVTEKRFDIKFTVGEIVVLKNVADMINLITEKLEKK